MVLLVLPTEIIVKIFDLSEIYSVVACRLVCHKLKDIIDGSLLLQYIVSLSSSGLCDGGRIDLPVADRLEALKAYRQERRSDEHEVGWREHTTLSKLCQHRMPSLVSGSLLAFADPENSRIVLHQLAQPLRGIDEEQWEIPLREKELTACMDVSQDLLVLVQIHSSSTENMMPHRHLVFRSLSTGGDHPDAQSLAEIDIQVYEDINKSSTNIYGDYLLMVVIDRPASSLCVWNWKTGLLEMKMPLEAPPDVAGYTFLDDTRLIILKAHPIRSRLRVFQFRRHGQTPDAQAWRHLPVFSFSFMDIARSDLMFLAPCPSLCGSHRRGLFYRDPSERIFVVAMNNFTSAYTSFFIRADMLLSAVQKASAKSTSSLTEIPWEHGRIGMGFTNDMRKRWGWPQDREEGALADVRVLTYGPQLSLWDFSRRRVACARAGQRREAQPGADALQLICERSTSRGGSCGNLVHGLKRTMERPESSFPEAVGTGWWRPLAQCIICEDKLVFFQVRLLCVHSVKTTFRLACQG
ncbi:hypothetical protein FA95DRAFT_428448 [Auriscalpium vulgare]|uniref:Uncharacterized protein n=1 Tax=Auriscalpium vulgare TaxID=40419 RepID=A0ACB8RI18_9AGAM|nr:hypothetical protein FA95DRAFT_428448 [Auriscalpium vulgare]